MKTIATILTMSLIVICVTVISGCEGIQITTPVTVIEAGDNIENVDINGEPIPTTLSP